jgi:serine/threonine protein kinase
MNLFNNKYYINDIFLSATYTMVDIMDILKKILIDYDEHFEIFYTNINKKKIYLGQNSIKSINIEEMDDNLEINFPIYLFNYREINQYFTNYSPFISIIKYGVHFILKIYENIIKFIDITSDGPKFVNEPKDYSIVYTIYKFNNKDFYLKCNNNLCIGKKINENSTYKIQSLEFIENKSIIIKKINQNSNSIILEVEYMNQNYYLKKFFSESIFNNENKMYNTLTDYDICLLKFASFNDNSILIEIATPLKSIKIEKNRFRLIKNMIKLISVLITQTNIIHGDLKIDNLVIDQNSKIKLIDFGGSIQIKSNEEYSKRIIGTYGYMPPEAFIKEENINFLYDIFSLGIIIYEIIYNVNPIKIFFEKKNIEFTKENMKILDSMRAVTSHLTW